MEDLSIPLSEAECDWLDNFLLERIDEDLDPIDQDEGILGLSELDGLFTAVVSGPVAIPPSQWLPAVWGDFEPDWQDEAQFRQVITLFMRHMNGISGCLMDQPEQFEPIFLEREVEGQCYAIVDEWCDGYMRGVLLAEQAWQLDNPEIQRLIEPIRAFYSGADWPGHALPMEQLQAMQQRIGPAACELHAYWLARRADLAAFAPSVRQTPKVGRNEPCPCGSGKKYKKCCLH